MKTRDRKTVKLDRASILADARRELDMPSRRLFGKRLLTLGGLSLLTGCSITYEESVNRFLPAVSRLNDRAQALLFDPNRLAPTYTEAQLTRPFPFNAFYGIDDVPDVNGSDYRLKVSGLVTGQRIWTLPELYAHAPCRADHAAYLRGRMERGRTLGRHAVRRVPASRGRGHHREVCRLSLRGRLLREHRHADGAESADPAYV